MSSESSRSSRSARSTRPHRMCVGCRERATKDTLLRVVAADLGDGWEVVPDPRSRAPGRGAHLHPTPGCLTLALRRRALARALRVPTGPAGRLDTGRLEACVQQWSHDRSSDHTDREKY